MKIFLFYNEFSTKKGLFSPCFAVIFSKRRPCGLSVEYIGKKRKKGDFALLRFYFQISPAIVLVSSTLFAANSRSLNAAAPRSPLT